MYQIAWALYFNNISISLIFYQTAEIFIAVIHKSIVLGTRAMMLKLYKCFNSNCRGHHHWEVLNVFLINFEGPETIILWILIVIFSVIKLGCKKTFLLTGNLDFILIFFTDKSWFHQPAFQKFLQSIVWILFSTCCTDTGHIYIWLLC